MKNVSGSIDDYNKMTAHARDATTAEREELGPRLTAMFPNWGYFQSQTARPFPIVILSPTGSLPSDELAVSPVSAQEGVIE